MIPYAKEYQEKDNGSDISPDFNYKEEKIIKWYHYVLLNRPSKVVTVLILTAIICPVIIYQFVFLNNLESAAEDGFSTGSCLVPTSNRIPCGYSQNNILEEDCDPQCCYDHETNTCFHRYPSRFSYILDRFWNEDVDMFPRISTVPYASQKSFSRLRISVDETSRTSLSVSIYNADVLSQNGSRIQDKLYSYNIRSPEFDVEVIGPQGTVFSTMRGPLIASENIWEVAFKLTEETLFGLGEIPLKRTSKIIYNHKGGLSSIPLIFAKLNGSFHGVLIDVQTPTEVSILDGNYIHIRSLTNEGLKFHIFLGPEPKDIMLEVMTLMGYQTKLEYWMLGAHVCSSSDQEETWATLLTNLQNFLRDASREIYPYESHCGLAPMVMEESCEAVPAQIATGARLLGNFNKKFVPQISPYIKYDDTILRNDTTCTTVSEYEDQLLVDPRTGEIHKGLANTFTVVYPSYENATDVLLNMWVYDLTFDGVILENSWPLDESFQMLNETYNDLPYFNENFEQAFMNTIFWNSSHSNEDKHMHRHNLYGDDFASAFSNITDDVPTLSTSQWMNGKLGINRQSINTTWTDLHRELIQAAIGGVSGHWLWSSPICGDTNQFNADLHSELCIKWYSAGVFLPMIKIHSVSEGRDPMTLTGILKTAALNALQTRQNLIPYFFTVLQEGPLLRPMFYQYPHSEDLMLRNDQFMVGDNILIVPNLLPQQSHVHFILPPGSWFELWSGLPINGEEGDVVSMTTAQTEFLSVMRGGSIIPLQKGYSTSATTSRLQLPYSLIIALDREFYDRFDIVGLPLPPDTKFESEGRLFIAENMTISFKADNETLTITTIGEDFTVLCGTGAESAATINEINIYGLDTEFNNFDHHKRLDVSVNMCDLELQDALYIDLMEIASRSVANEVT